MAEIRLLAAVLSCCNVIEKKGKQIYEGDVISPIQGL